MSNTTESLRRLLVDGGKGEINSVVRNYVSYCKTLKDAGILKDNSLSLPMLDTLGVGCVSKYAKRHCANSDTTEDT